MLVAVVLSGCSSRTVSHPATGQKIYESTRFGNKESVKRVEYTGPNGERFVLEGYQSDQAEGLGIVAYSTARGVAEGFGGGGGSSLGALAPVVAQKLTKDPQAPAGYKIVPKDDPSVPQLVYPDEK